MKMAKRLSVLVLTLILLVAMAVPVCAEEVSSSTGGATKAVITKNQGKYTDKTVTLKYKSDNAESYVIKYRTKGGSWKTVKTTDTSYTLKLKKNGLYEIKVAGVGSDGKTGAFSKVTTRFMASAKTKATSPKKKTIKVTAPKVKNATGWMIQYSQDKSFKKGSKTIRVNSASALNKTIKGLKKGTWYVRVRPICKKGGKTYLGVYNKKTVKVK